MAFGARSAPNTTTTKATTPPTDTPSMPALHDSERHARRWISVCGFFGFLALMLPVWATPGTIVMRHDLLVHPEQQGWVFFWDQLRGRNALVVAITLLPAALLALTWIAWKLRSPAARAMLLLPVSAATLLRAGLWTTAPVAPGSTPAFVEVVHEMNRAEVFHAVRLWGLFLGLGVIPAVAHRHRRGVATGTLWMGLAAVGVAVLGLWGDLQQLPALGSGWSRAGVRWITGACWWGYLGLAALTGLMRWARGMDAVHVASRMAIWSLPLVAALLERVDGPPLLLSPQPSAAAVFESLRAGSALVAQALAAALVVLLLLQARDGVRDPSPVQAFE